MPMIIGWAVGLLIGLVAGVALISVGPEPNIYTFAFWVIVSNVFSLIGIAIGVDAMSKGPTK